MNDLSAEVAAIKTEIKYLKWIIPSACALVALLILIFWGVERKNIGNKVRAVIQTEGVQTALQETQEAAKKIKDIENQATADSELIANQKDTASKIIQDINRRLEDLGSLRLEAKLRNTNSTKLDEAKFDFEFPVKNAWVEPVSFLAEIVRIEKVISGSEVQVKVEMRGGGPKEEGSCTYRVWAASF